MSRVGMGVIYTKTAFGNPLRADLNSDEREALLDRYYRAHHQALARAVEAALAEDNSCVVVDCHSFPSQPLPYELDQASDRPEICIGTDAFHTSDELLESAVKVFSSASEVRVNRPFSGALVPSSYYHKDKRVQALMIEVNRKLYMDEATGNRTADFSSVRKRLQNCLRETFEF